MPVRWLQDCWHDNYNGAPSDGSAWEGGDCANRSTRSGSYDNGPKYMRSAYRGYLRNDGTVRQVDLGFRLAQNK